jgi:hypothetical protein
MRRRTARAVSGAFGITPDLNERTPAQTGRCDCGHLNMIHGETGCLAWAPEADARRGMKRAITACPCEKRG